MARLESIGKGRLGKAGSMIDGTPPRPPKAPVPPKPVRQQTSTVKKRAPIANAGTQHDRDEPLN